MTAKGEPVGSVALEAMLPVGRRRARTDRIVRLWIEDLNGLGDRLAYVTKYPDRARSGERDDVEAALARVIDALLAGGPAVPSAVVRLAGRTLEGPEDAFGLALVMKVLRLEGPRWGDEELRFALEGQRIADEALRRLGRTERLGGDDG